MTVWYYGRVSTDHQENSAANQEQVFSRMAEAEGVDYRIVIEENVPGTVPLKERPQGKKVWDALQPGDSLVVLKLDRGWRSMEDAAHTLNVLRRIGVRLKILDLPVDISTDEGEMIFLQFATWAQYDNRLRGRRVRDVNDYRKRNGMPYSTTRPFGWVRKGDTWAVLQAERDIADMVADMHDGGMSYADIRFQLARRGVCRPYSHSKKKGYYSISQLHGLLLARGVGYPRVSQSQMRVGVRGETPSSKAGHAPQTNT